MPAPQIPEMAKELKELLMDAIIDLGQAKTKIDVRLKDDGRKSNPMRERLIRWIKISEDISHLSWLLWDEVREAMQEIEAKEKR